MLFIFLSVAITFYALLAIEFFVRFYTDRPLRSKLGEKGTLVRMPLDRTLKMMIAGLALSSLFLYIRYAFKMTAAYKKPVTNFYFTFLI